MYKLICIFILIISGITFNQEPKVESIQTTSSLIPPVSIKDTINSEIIDVFFDSDTTDISSKIYLLQ